MSIEVGKQYIGKDGEVVEVLDVIHYRTREGDYNFPTVIFKGRSIHVLTEYDFLEQYKPYEPVYEWQWYKVDNGVAHLLRRGKDEVEFFTEERIINMGLGRTAKRIEETKRECKG